MGLIVCRYWTEQIEANLPCRGDFLVDCLGDLDVPLSEALTVAVPMMTTIYYIRPGVFRLKLCGEGARERQGATVCEEEKAR